MERTKNGNGKTICDVRDAFYMRVFSNCCQSVAGHTHTHTQDTEQNSYIYSTALSQAAPTDTYVCIYIASKTLKWNFLEA